MTSLGQRCEEVSQHFRTKAQGINEVNKRKEEIIHTCPSSKGQDGAPIIVIDAYKRMMIVGIHRGGILVRQKCLSFVGRLMTEKLLKNILLQA